MRVILKMGVANMLDTRFSCNKSTQARSILVC
jgi:hypothetical protein